MTVRHLRRHGYAAWCAEGLCPSGSRLY